jgi:hypothetical protein
MVSVSLSFFGLVFGRKLKPLFWPWLGIGTFFDNCELLRARLWWPFLLARFGEGHMQSKASQASSTIGFIWRPCVNTYAQEAWCGSSVHVTCRYYAVAGQSRGICVGMRDHG